MNSPPTGERATAPAQRSASAVRHRPVALGVALPDLAAMLGRHGVGQARNRVPVAPQGLPALLATPITSQGRPKKSIQVRDLIRRMSMANPLWGAPRVHGELPKTRHRGVPGYRRQIRECLDHILKLSYFSTAAVAAISSSISGQANALTPTDAPGGSSAPASANSSVRHLPEAPM